MSAEAAPSPEVLAKPTRRRFSKKYKLSIVKKAERCTEPGSIGALLRREGLYSSHLGKWRRLYEAGELTGTTSRKRGPAAKAVNPLENEVKRLEREKRALERKLKQAELVIDFQKKFAEMLEAAKENDDRQ
jgi:transposase-like protein